MKIGSRLRFIVQDLVAPRARLEVTVGALSIASGAVVLLVVLSFTQGVYRFVDSRFHGAKPVIGSVFVRLKSGDQFSKSQVEEIEKFADKNPELIESVSWYCGRIDLQVKRNRQVETAESPVVWAFPYDSCDLLDPLNGIRFVTGRNLNAQVSTTLPAFGVLLNVKFLEDFLAFTEVEIKDVLKGNLKLLPEEIWFHFPPIKTVDGYPWYEPKDLTVPISGVVCLRDDIFPHMFVTPEVAGAFFYEDRQRWESSYALQFQKVNGSGELVPKENYTTVDGLDMIDRQGRNWVVLPDSSKLRDLKNILPGNMTPFQSAVLLVRNYRRAGLRSELKQRLEQPVEIWRAKQEEKDRVLEMLEKKQVTSLRNLLTSPIGLKQNYEATSVRTGNEGEDFLSIDKRQGIWLLYDSGSETQYRITEDNNQIIVFKQMQWDVDAPSDTVSEALNQITGLVDFYSNIVSATIGLLSTLIALLLGIGYIRRKRKDIGILKACGINPLELALIYGSQVLCVCAAGAIFGIATAWMAAPFLESSAQALIGDFQLDFAFTDTIMIVRGSEIFETLKWVMIGALVGIIVPCWQAITVNPMEDLRTGL